MELQENSITKPNLHGQFQRSQVLVWQDLLHTQGKPQSAMKKKGKRKHACQTSINTHPARVPEDKTDRVEIIKRNNSLYSSRTRQLPPSLRTEREDQKYSLLGAEDIQSSTRVDSMALLGTKARDKHYRNDSPVEKTWLAAALRARKATVRGAHTEVLST